MKKDEIDKNRLLTDLNPTLKRLTPFPNKLTDCYKYGWSFQKYTVVKLKTFLGS